MLSPLGSKCLRYFHFSFGEGFLIHICVMWNLILFDVFNIDGVFMCLIDKCNIRIAQAISNKEASSTYTNLKNLLLLFLLQVLS